MSRKRLLLIGAGHTHLHLVRAWQKRTPADVEVKVVSQFPTATYSGMLPGTLAGLYHPDEMTIRVQEICQACGMVAHLSQATKLNEDLHSVTLEDGQVLEADYLSFGTGSESFLPQVSGKSPGLIPIKPMPTFLQRLAAWKAWHLKRSQLQRGKARPRIAILGAGAAGIEIAFSINEMFWKQSIPAQVTIYDRNDVLLPERKQKTRTLILNELERRGIEGRWNCSCEQLVATDEMTAADPVQLTLSDQSVVGCDLVLVCMGAVPNAMTKSAPVKKDDRGFLAIRETLQLLEHDHLFAVGDTATFIANPHPKAGVYAVRQGAFLEHNLSAMMLQRPLKSYRPQSSFLSLIATGDERAFVDYAGFSRYGRWEWWLKDRIDRTFMRKYQSLYSH